jgi:hypothetical protein
MSVLSVVGCQVEVSANCPSLFWLSLTECGVSEYDLQNSMKGPRSTSVVESWGKKVTRIIISDILSSFIKVKINLAA